jgi:hypothetical protein
MSPALLVLLTIRLYSSTLVADRDLVRARHEAAEILAHSGVSVAWVDCRAGTRADPRCTAPLGPRELSVRFLGTADARARDLPLGESLIDIADGGGSLATLCPNRIKTLSAAARLPLGIVMGRAMAHEIGHLLLGATAHDRAGVMRPAWSVSALRAGGRRDWQFSSTQTQQLRERLTRSESTADPRDSHAAQSTQTVARIGTVGLSLAP